MKNLIQLNLDYSIDAELIRKIFEKLKFFSRFEFKHNDRTVKIRMDFHKNLSVLLDFYKSNWKSVPDLNAAIKFVIESTKRRL